MLRSMARADLLRPALLAAAAAFLLGAGTASGPVTPDASRATPDASRAAPEKRYPANRAAELKARLLEQPGDAAAPSWALE